MLGVAAGAVSHVLVWMHPDFCSWFAAQVVGIAMQAEQVVGNTNAVIRGAASHCRQHGVTVGVAA